MNLNEQDTRVFNSTLTSPGTRLELPTKSNNDRLYETSRNRRDLSLVFNDQSIEFDNNKLPDLDSVNVIRNPLSNNEISSKNCIDVSIGEVTIVRFNQTLENYLKVSVGNDTYIITKYVKIQFIGTTQTKFRNIGSDLLQKWNIKCNNKNIDSKSENFIKSTITKTLTGHSAATSLPPIRHSFMYIETSSNYYGHVKNFVSFERTNIIKISHITFFYNRSSFLHRVSIKSMVKFWIHILLEDNPWSTQYNIPKNDRYSDSSTDWTLVNLRFTVEKYVIKLIRYQ